MPLQITSYEEWMRLSAGSLFSTRNAYLVEVDKAIKNYHKEGQTPERRKDIKECLESYIYNYESRKAGGVNSWKNSTFNSHQALSRLFDAVSSSGSEKPIVQEDPIVPKPKLATRSTTLFQPRPHLDQIKVGLSNLRRVIPSSKPEASLYQIDQMRQNQNQMRRNQNSAIAIYVNSLNTDLQGCRTDVIAAMLKCKTNYMAGMGAGYATFTNLYNKDADNKEFKLSVAKKVFEAIGSLPPPINSVGMVGGIIVGQLKVNHINGPANALEVKIPDPTGLMKAILDANNIIEKHTTVNALPSTFAECNNNFRSVFEKFEVSVMNAWDSHTAIIATTQAREILIGQLVEVSRKEFYGGLPDQHQIDLSTTRIKNELDALAKEMRDKFKDVIAIKNIGNNDNEVAVWVCMQFIVDYALNGVLGVVDSAGFEKMEASVLEAKDIGEPFIDFLDHHVGVIQRDKITTGGREKSQDIFAKGKIPWQGHPSHKVALFMYLEWAQRHINPMDLITKSLTNDRSPNDFREKSTAYIKKLGLAINTKAQGAFLGFGHRKVQGTVGSLSRS
jgi:hypothetical protein